MAKAASKTITTKKPRIVPDPILDLISEARRRINEFDLAHGATRRLRQKIGEHNCGPAVVFGPEYFAYVNFGTEFHSVGQIDRGQKCAEIRLRKEIMGIQKELKRKRIGDVERVKYLAMIARDKLALHQIKEAADWLRAEWRRREVRSGTLRARSGFDRAAMRRIKASAAAVLAPRRNT
jgi:hypothetical protein